MRLSEQAVTSRQVQLVTHLVSKDNLPIIQRLQQESGILPQTLLKDPAFLQMASNIFYLGRTNKDRNLQMLGNTINTMSDLQKIRSVRSIEELNDLINGSAYGDPAFGINNATNNQDLRKIKAFATAFIRIAKLIPNRNKKSLKQKAKDLVKNPAKAFSDFSNAISNPGNTADILAQPFKNN